MTSSIPIAACGTRTPSRSRLFGDANYPVTLFGYNHRIDIAIPARVVAFEYQGEGHFTVAERRKDMTRRSRLEAAGRHVMELNLNDLRDPVELEARIRAFLALWP